MMQTYKILVVSPRYYPDSTAGGSVTGCRSIVNVFHSAGNHVEVLTIDTTSIDGRGYEEILDGVRIVACR